MEMSIGLAFLYVIELPVKKFFSPKIRNYDIALEEIWIRNEGENIWTTPTRHILCSIANLVNLSANPISDSGEKHVLCVQTLACFSSSMALILDCCECCSSLPITCMDTSASRAGFHRGECLF